jgi:FkbM family methyltransferase
MNQIFDHPTFATTRLRQALLDRPIGFVDVGARGAVHPLVAPLASGVAVLGFDPDPNECRRIEALATGFAQVRMLPQALAGSSGPRALHLLAVPTNHSLLPPNPAFVERYRMEKWREVGQEELSTTTLDEALGAATSSGITWGEVLKLDTQGSELEILEGAAATLARRTVAVVTEVSFAELYRGQGLFSELELLLRRHGFAFYGFDEPRHRSRRLLDKRTHWTRERVFQADAIFFRDPLGSGAAKLDARGCEVLFLVALAAGYHDFALELAREVLRAADRPGLEALCRARAALDPADAVRDVAALHAAVAHHPAEANVEVARFVDGRRQRNDVAELALP